MVLACPKCAKAVPEDAVYCPYCGYGVKPSARTIQVSLGASLVLVATAASLIHFILSIKALMQIYVWYPPVVTQNWIIYDQMLAIFTLASFLLGLFSSTLLLLRRSFRLSVASAFLLTISCVAAWTLSIVEPFSNLGSSFFYFFLPLVLPALIGTLLVYPRKAEFDPKKSSEHAQVVKLNGVFSL